MDAPGFWPLFATRLPALLALLTLCGAAVWALLVRDSPPRRGHPLAAAALGAAAVLVLARGAQLYAQVRAFFTPDPFGVEEMRTMATATTWGAGWQVQTAVAVVAVLAAALCRLGGAGSWSLLGIVAVAGVLAQPLTGHAVENGWWSLPYFLQALHVAGAGLWIGALAVLTVSARRAGTDHDRLARRVDRFSPIALSGAGLLAIAGLATAWMYLSVPGDLWGTAWGRALLLKLTVLAGVMALGHHNWRRVLPVMGSPEATARLRRSTAAELLLALLLLAVTAVLVALPMPAAMAG